LLVRVAAQILGGLLTEILGGLLTDVLRRFLA
jgi:hypothetical protein